MGDHAGQQAGDGPADKLGVLRERLLSEASAIRTAGAWDMTLRAMARLPAESFANTLLIEARKPGATLVRGYEEWRAAGRQVSRGEQGIEVFSAACDRPGGPRQTSRSRREPEPPAPGWRDARRVAYVWDISQTGGQPVATRAAHAGAPGEVPAGTWDALCWLARREGFAVEHEHGAPVDGVTFWAAHRIRVLPGLDPPAAVWALAHQLGHVIAHGAQAHPPGATTSGDACAGARKAVADAVAFITCARYGIDITHQPASPATWAGTDSRAQSAEVILAVGQSITAAAARVTRHLDHSLPLAAPAIAARAPAREPSSARAPRQPAASGRDPRPAPGRAAAPAVPEPRLAALLRDADTFYSGRLDGTWVPAYLHSRGIGPDAIGQWRAGYAPADWSSLTDHLRAAGYADEEIEAAGLARRSSRGTLIDHFRDRVMLPVHDRGGRIAGFIGRAKPGAGTAVPKYLNSPETSLYKKGELLFGLHEASAALAAGATPVIAEGPFDAIAITLAGDGRLAGLAPCGTALTAGQAALLSATCDLEGAGALAAFDGDPAGCTAAIRAYSILRPFTANLRSAELCGRDPAQILQEQGPKALREALTGTAGLLLSVVVDADVARWEHQPGEVEGPVHAMRSAAALLARLLPPGAAAQVREATGGTMLTTVDEEMRPVTSPQLPGIARSLPADTACQVTRLADQLGFTVSEVVIEVVNAVSRQSSAPAIPRQPPTGLAAGSFPAGPLEKPVAGIPAQPQRAPQAGRHRAPSRQA